MTRPPSRGQGRPIRSASNGSALHDEPADPFRPRRVVGPRPDGQRDRDLADVGGQDLVGVGGRPIGDEVGEERQGRAELRGLEDDRCPTRPWSGPGSSPTRPGPRSRPGRRPGRCCPASSPWRTPRPGTRRATTPIRTSRVGGAAGVDDVEGEPVARRLAAVQAGAEIELEQGIGRGPLRDLGMRRSAAGPGQLVARRPGLHGQERPVEVVALGRGVLEVVGQDHVERHVDAMLGRLDVVARVGDDRQAGRRPPGRRPDRGPTTSRPVAAMSGEREAREAAAHGSRSSGRRAA